MTPVPEPLYSARNGTVRMSVGVSNLSVDADIGINPDEIGILQPLILDILVGLSGVVSDDIATTIDYRALSEMVQRLAAERTGLIETFALNLAADIRGLGMVSELSIRIRKPQALDNGTAETRLVWRAESMPFNWLCDALN